MSLLLIGANHKTAPVKVRERMAISEGDAGAFLQMVRGVEGVGGAALLSTCNRVEMIVSGKVGDAAEDLVALLSSRAGIHRSEIEEHLYILRDGEVVRHLFRVASGLDSMIVGEPQIGGQVRSCYRLAQELKTLDSTLQKLFENTMRVAKKARTETSIGENAVSIPYAAVELAKKIFGDLAGLQVMVAGAGKMGALTAEHLHSFGLEKVLVANRAFEKAVELAKHFNGQPVPFEDLGAHLAECDIVVVSTAAPDYIIGPELVKKAMGTRRRRRDMFLIDLSVPRNIDPEVGSLDGAYLYNVDDLKDVADRNLELRLERAEEAESIIDREVAAFLRLLASQDVIPTIVELQGRLEEIRAAELEKCLRRMGPVTAEQREAVEAMTSAIVNKVLHYPIVRLRESAADHEAGTADLMRDTIRKIFGLK